MAKRENKFAKTVRKEDVSNENFGLGRPFDFDDRFNRVAIIGALIATILLLIFRQVTGSGTGSVIAAGAVVTKGTIVEPYSLMAGIPAKCIKKLPETNMKTIHSQAIKYKTLWTEGYGILPDADGESYHGEKIMD